MSAKPKKPEFPRDLRLFRRAAMGNRELAEKMVKQWPDIVHDRSEPGETALHYAAIENDLEAVKWLITKGSVVDNRENLQDTPLMHAAKLGHGDMCKLLIKAGANVTAANEFKETALHQSTSYGYTEI